MFGTPEIVGEFLRPLPEEIEEVRPRHTVATAVHLTSSGFTRVQHSTSCRACLTAACSSNESCIGIITLASSSHILCHRSRLHLSITQLTPHLSARSLCLTQRQCFAAASRRCGSTAGPWPQQPRTRCGVRHGLPHPTPAGARRA
jgi:hypothetical protein